MNFVTSGDLSVSHGAEETSELCWTRSGMLHVMSRWWQMVSEEMAVPPIHHGFQY